MAWSGENNAAPQGGLIWGQICPSHPLKDFDPVILSPTPVNVSFPFTYKPAVIVHIFTLSIPPCSSLQAFTDGLPFSSGSALSPLQFNCHP